MRLQILLNMAFTTVFPLCPKRSFRGFNAFNSSEKNNNIVIDYNRLAINTK